MRGPPPKERLRDLVSGETYDFVEAFNSGWAIGTDKKGHEHALLPGTWERFGGKPVYLAAAPRLTDDESEEIVPPPKRRSVSRGAKKTAK